MSKQQLFPEIKMPMNADVSRSTRPYIKWAIVGCIAFLMVHMVASMFLVPMLPAVMLLLEAITVLYCTSNVLREPQRYLAVFTGSTLTSTLVKLGLITLPLSLVLVGVFNAPAHAAFYSDAEAFITSSFPEASTVVPLLFNTLRMLLLLYLGISLVNVMNALRQGEEWMAVFRTPAITIFVVAISDILTSIIIS